jgi:hypothetical protein
MALTLPANIKTYQDRKLMTLEADDYLFILKEFHRLLRRILTPTVYTIFCAIEDHAGPGETKDVPEYTCSASTTTLGEDDTQTSRMTVYRAILTLKKEGLVTVEDREGLTALIRPIVTSEQRAAFLLKGDGVNPACINLIQDTYPNLSQNDTRNMTTCINLIQPPVSKRYTNGTKLKQEEIKTLDTNVSNGPSGPTPIDNPLETEIELEEIETHSKAANALTAPPPDSRGLKRRWREAYEAVQDDFKARSGVMGKLWTEITGKKPDYSQLNQLARDHNSMWVVCEGILKMANCEVIDDPLVYLRKVLQNGNNAGGNDRGRSGIATGKNGAHPTAPTGTNSSFEPGFWDTPDAKERARAAWSLSP